jgi:hypothetical protein
MEPELEQKQKEEPVVEEKILVCEGGSPKVEVRQKTSSVKVIEVVDGPLQLKTSNIDDPNVQKLADQLATFRADVKAESSSFSYHQAGVSKVISLAFQEIEDAQTKVRLKLKAVETESKKKVKELNKVISTHWNVDIGRRNTFEAFVYFLKYRRLESRDKDALNKLRVELSRGGICFIFVDAVFESIPKVIKKLKDLGHLPGGAIFFPWGDKITDEQKKAMIGLTMSAKFEDMTESRRTITRVLIPKKRM